MRVHLNFVVSHYSLRDLFSYSKIGGRRSGGFCGPKEHSFACEGEAAELDLLENRSHAIGQSQISAPCYGKAGVIRSAFTRRFYDGQSSQHIYQLRDRCGSGDTGAHSCCIAGG
jgi:hypothetical protein